MPPVRQSSWVCWRWSSSPGACPGTAGGGAHPFAPGRVAVLGGDPCSNTLGTALGDFLADDSGLGFAGGALLIGGLLALVSLAHWFTRISGVLLFWIAFVLTRPFGATLGDVLTKPHEKGGLDFGTVGSSLVLLSILALFVAYAAYDGSRSSDRVGATS